MKYLQQLLIILTFCFAGELLHDLIPLPIPANIYGIILLFLALESKLVRPENIQQTSDFLIGIMPLMFLPSAVGLMNIWDSMKGSVVQYIIIMLVSTFVVMAVSGWATQGVMRLKERRQQR